MRRKFSTLLLTIFFVISFSVTAFAESTDAPSIYGKSGIVIDAQTGEIIYAKDIDASPMYPASTTKLLTALLLAENKKPTDVLTYTESAASQPAYSLYNLVGRNNLKVGDKMTAENAMKALLLFSANDVAYMIADNVAGSAEKFADMMNAKAKELGLKNSHFVTPNGIDNGIDDHYTSAYDLAIITKTAYSNEWVRKAMNTKNDKVELLNDTIGYITNRNKLLGETLNDAYLKAAGVDTSEVPASNAVSIGGKTGYTAKSGRTLTNIFDKDGRVLIGVVMKSNYDAQDTYVFNDMAKIINWAYSAKKTTLYKANSELKTLSVKYKPLKFFGPEKELKIPVTIKEDVTYYDNEVNKNEMKTDFQISENLSVRDINPDKSIGKLILSERDAKKNYDLYPTISSSAVFKDNIILYLGTGIGVIIVVFLLIIIIRAIGIKRRNRRRRNRRYF